MITLWSDVKVPNVLERSSEPDRFPRRRRLGQKRTQRLEHGLEPFLGRPLELTESLFDLVEPACELHVR